MFITLYILTKYSRYCLVTYERYMLKQLTLRC